MQGVIYLFLIYTFLAWSIFGFTYQAIFALSIGMNAFYICLLIIHNLQNTIDENKTHKNPPSTVPLNGK